MAARPAKRQRRSTVVVSDDEEDALVSPRLPLRTQTSSTTSEQANKPRAIGKSLRSNSRNSSTSTSPATSPQKSRKTSKQVVEIQNNKSLHSFFSKATEEQRWQRRAETPHQDSQEDTLIDDIIDDDEDGEDDTALQSRGLQRVLPNYRVQTELGSSLRATQNTRANGNRSSNPASSQRFSKPRNKSSLTAELSIAKEHEQVTEHRPWADRFGPSVIDELAVHKRKVADVQKWLEDVTIGRSPQKVLILKGPAGSGKSTTISLLAQSMGINVVSWHNPTVSDTNSVSATQQFADFLDRGGQFEALTFENSAFSERSQPSQPPPKLERRLLMIEEFPTTSRMSNMLDSFRTSLLQHIQRSAKPHQFGRRDFLLDQGHPVVLIVSETLLTSSTALSDSFTAHRLLGPELLNHPLLNVIEFNPVAPTFISKAIDLVIKKEARESKRRRLPGPAILQQLADVGDIRSAINSLEFLCARGEDGADWSGTVAAHSKKQPKGNIPLTESEKNALQLISQRESTLDMFHAAGKIVYNKREDPRVLDSRTEPPPKPPDHLMYLYNPKVSQVDVDALLNETGTNIQTFVSTLHENYVLSCNVDEVVDHFDSCAHVFSDSDFLNPESRSLIRVKGNARLSSSNYQSGNSDMLRQDEISFQVAARGLLFSLPYPVSRAVPSGSRKQDAFKMFYPASLRLWKPAEEIYELLSMFSTMAVSGSPNSSNNNTAADGVASWKSRGLTLGSLQTLENSADPTTTDTARSFLLKDNLVTELLPYLTKIREGQSGDVQVLKKITQLRGINMSGDELLDEEQYDGNAKVASASAGLKQRVEEAHNILQARKRQMGSRGLNGSIIQGHDEVSNGVSEAAEKLYISDDDIQDD